MLIQTGYLNMLVFEQPTIHIGKLQQFRVIVGVAVLWFGIKNTEQFQQRFTDIVDVLVRHFFQIVMEFAVPGKKPCIFGIHTEHKPDAQLIQTAQRLRVVRVLIFCENRIIQCADKFTGL